MQIEDKCYEFENFKDLDFSPNLNESIKNIIKEEGFITYNVNKKLVNISGNFMGVLYEIDIQGKTADGDKEVSVFVKNITATKELAFIDDAYSRENYVYRELSRIFTELQDDAGVPLTERLNMVKSYDETNEQAIILENMNKRSFKVCDRYKVISLEFAELSIQQLARFHALSFVIANRKPEYFEKKIKPFKFLINFNETIEIFVKNTCDVSMQYLNDIGKKKAEKYISKLFLKFQNFLTDSTSTICCLCHGDSRSNNLLAKEINGKITEVVLIDYQMIFYGCPLIDFFYFIYGATDRDFRDKHLNHLKNSYYENLNKFLNYFDIQAESVYPRKRFEKEYEETLEFGLIVSLFSLPFIFVKEGDTPDLAKEDLRDLKIKVDERIRDRVQGAIDEFIERGYL